MFQFIYRLIARVLGGKTFGIAWVQIVLEEHIGDLRISINQTSRLKWLSGSA